MKLLKLTCIAATILCVASVIRAEEEGEDDDAYFNLLKDLIPDDDQPSVPDATHTGNNGGGTVEHYEHDESEASDEDDDAPLQAGVHFGTGLKENTWGLQEPIEASDEGDDD